jgi:hypothetical protein
MLWKHGCRLHQRWLSQRCLQVSHRGLWKPNCSRPGCLALGRYKDVYISPSRYPFQQQGSGFLRTVASRPRFGCYEPARSKFSCAEVAEGSAGQATGGKVARWRGVKVERTYIDVLSSLGRQTIRQLLPIILCTPVCCAQHGPMCDWHCTGSSSNVRPNVRSQSVLNLQAVHSVLQYNQKALEDGIN